MNKGIENLKRNWIEILELRTKTVKMKTSLEEFNSRYKQVDKKISKLEDRAAEITQCEEQKMKRMKWNEQSLRALCDTTKHTNIHIIGVSNWKRYRKVKANQNGTLEKNQVQKKAALEELRNRVI